MITQTDKLLYGVEVDGVVHTDFEMRLPMIGDNIAAIEEMGVGSNLRLHVGIMARSLVKLGTLAPEQITATLLMEKLVDEDFDVLDAAEKALKKKRKESNQPSLDTGSPSSSSGAPESPSPASLA